MKKLTTDDLPDSYEWPSAPREKCLHCDIRPPRRHSWFCDLVCEDLYIREHGITLKDVIKT